ncbi:MAG: hypothetical protein ACJAX7_002234 [Saprospiraceae bacterium]|jgi:hypothetical protein
MKKIFTLLTFVITMTTIAQSVSINSDGSEADPSAILEVKSTTKGFLAPRMTKVQRNAIASPATGLQIWCSDCSSLGLGEIQNYNGSAWIAVTPSSTADIAASIDKNYVTDAQVKALENTSGVNTGDNATNSQYSNISTDVSVNNAKVGITESQANEIAENNAKVGYTEALVSANETVVANTNKVGITNSQASEIVENNAKVGYTDALVSANTDVVANTSKVGITDSQASEIVENNAKVGYTEALVSANETVVANTNKVGITDSQASEIVENNAKVGYTEILVSANTDVLANTAKVVITDLQTIDITDNKSKITNATHTGDVTGSDALTIGDKKVLAKHLNSITTPTNGDVLTYVGSTNDIQWSPFRFPNVTEEERNALTPIEGMMIYNNTTHKPNYYNGTSWMNYDGTSAED